DNVLAVAGVSRHNEFIMVFGLVLSVVLMGVAASFIAGIIQRFSWIATVGIVVIIFAAIRMVWEDAHVFFPAIIPAIPTWLGGHPEAAAFLPPLLGEALASAELIVLEARSLLGFAPTLEESIAAEAALEARTSRASA